MAVFHHHFSYVKRGMHSSAIATAAHRSRSCLTLKTPVTESGKEEIFEYDYSKRLQSCFSKILGPSYMSPLLEDRQYLWQELENISLDRKPILAYESVFALPEELPLVKLIKLVKKFAHSAYQMKGYAVDVNIHAHKDDNAHVHFLIPAFGVDVETGLLSTNEPVKMRKCDRQKAEGEFVKITNEVLSLNGCEGFISNEPIAVPRYDSFRPWL